MDPTKTLIAALDALIEGDRQTAADGFADLHLWLVRGGDSPDLQRALQVALTAFRQHSREAHFADLDLDAFDPSLTSEE